jgi:phage terminase small subunit
MCNFAASKYKEEVDTMTKKQKCFIEEYLVDLNATQAAIRAGYSSQTAKEIGCENLAKPNIKSTIDKALAERSRRTGINQDRVIMELAKIAFLNPTDVIDMDEATIRGEAGRDDTACIASVKVKTIPTEDGAITEREVKTYDKIRALELLGKHLNMFTDKFKVDGVVPVVIAGSDELED